MKKKTAFTLAATVGAATAITPAILANNGQQAAAATDTNSSTQIGTIKIIAADGAQVFDANGTGITHDLKQVGTVWPVYGTGNFGTQSTYALGNNQYILASEVQFTAAQSSSVTLKTSITPASGTIQVSAAATATVYDSTGKATGKILPASSQWKYFGTTSINGDPYYSVGGDQFVAADMAAVMSAANASVSSDSATSSTQAETPAKTPTKTSTAAKTPTTSVKQAPSASKTPAIGQVRITTATATLLKNDGKSVVFNADGSVKRVTKGSTWKVFDVLRIGSGTYYDLGGGQYVGASHAQYSTSTSASTVSAPAVKAPAKSTSTAATKTSTSKSVSSAPTKSSTATVLGTVNITTATATLLKSDGHSVVYNANGSVKRVTKGSNWKVFGVLHVNGGIFYDLGGGQYVGASHVHYTAGTTRQTAPATTVFIAKATINYVPGYGIQVWHADNSAVTNANGTAKKLAHGTQWKVFSRLVKNGHVYYGLGGDQYIDSSYVIIS